MATNSYGFVSGFVTFVRLSKDGQKARVGIRANRLDQDGKRLVFEGGRYVCVNNFKPEETAGISVQEYISCNVRVYDDGGLSLTHKADGTPRWLTHKPCKTAAAQ
jgi:hypothetical protein